ncbi:nuclease PA3 [Byssothecium circinans]|uniref:Nuclease PA3 n=1 Tax=Byssothecium circinans TaxID=147558 RepID=A0A6A5U0D7_9PLEO|nr:nuclease PA3 [Byssothecium circinans]
MNPILPLIFLLTSASAWSTDVHNQIGFMAETFLTPDTTALLIHLLEPQYNSSIGRAAAWADAYAHTDEGRFSYQWHWIDAHDAPPLHCELDYDRDCSSGGCVVSAIANQTGILRECVKDVKSERLRISGTGMVTGTGTNLTCSYALKWVVHFIGDIAQPLHASGKAAGGNFYKAIFGNVSTELHAVWDTSIPYFAANTSSVPFSNQTLAPFFAGLVARIRRDQFFEAPYMWTKCTDPATPVECATSWARESNRWTCDYVYSRASSTEDLERNGYAAGAVPIVEVQIAKAAVRLATWLNRLVDEVQVEVEGGGAGERSHVGQVVLRQS